MLLLHSGVVVPYQLHCVPAGTELSELLDDEVLEELLDELAVVTCKKALV